MRIAIPKDTEITGVLVLEKILLEGSRVLGGEYRPTDDELRRRIDRAIWELEFHGGVIEAMEIERVHRSPASGGSMTPAIRIVLDCVDKSRALVLINTSEQGGKRTVEQISVAYSGEWPMCHHYSTAVPPPDIEALRDIVKHG